MGSSQINTLSEYEKYLENELKNENKINPYEYVLGFPTNYKQLDGIKNVTNMLANSRQIIIHVGDPFTKRKGFFSLSMKKEECALVTDLLKHWVCQNLQWWGYITTGGTEGNYAGFKFGMRYLNCNQPLIIFSDETHYSSMKIVELNGAGSRHLVVPTLKNGEMDCNSLKNLLLNYESNPENLKVFVLATLGTTMKDACDDVILIRTVIEECGVKNDNIYIHADAASRGGYWHLNKTFSKYQLGKEINSISFSCYKWHGGFNCGVFGVAMCDFKQQDFIEIMKLNDPSITGTRNGINILCWRARLLQFDWQKEYDYCQNMIEYCIAKFKVLNIEIFKNPSSLTIVFPCPPIELCYKYSLPSKSDKHLGNVTHLMVLPHFTERVMEEFFGDLEKTMLGISFTRKWFKVKKIIKLTSAAPCALIAIR